MHFYSYDSVPEYSEDQKVVDGETATRPADPTRPGYAFRGWSTGYSNDSPLYDFSTPVTSDILLYAQWDSYPYTIRYDANGGTGSMPDQKVPSRPSSTAATLKPNEFKYNGKVFTGWNTKPDGSGTAYKDNTAYGEFSATNADQVITLYAQWTDAKVKYIDAITAKCSFDKCYPIFPDEVTIHLSNGKTVTEDVDWNQEQAEAIRNKDASELHLGDVFYVDSISIVGFPNQKIRATVVVSDIAAPSIKGLDTISAKAGDRSFSTMYGISAVDDHDGDVTGNVTVSGKFVNDAKQIFGFRRHQSFSTA